ncbi:MAG: DUF4118 domain-containing protein, partial [Alphaproteobacteria bacterium]|nr:DUF4118 domain-containing protein [Alphaproteobacteria bacterium]
MLLSESVNAQLQHLTLPPAESPKTAKALFYILISVGLTVAAARGLVAAGFPSPESLSILFVLPVLWAAIFYGFALSLVAALLSVAAYNFALLAPIWHISLWEAENLAKLAVLILVAMIASGLSVRVRRLAREALQRERVLSGVYALSQDMLGIANLPEMRAAAQAKLAALLQSRVSVVLKDEVTADDEAA